VLVSIALEKSTWYQIFGDAKDIEITLEESFIRYQS